MSHSNETTEASSVQRIFPVEECKKKYKRLSYCSQFYNTITEKDIQEILKVATEKNTVFGVTGVLVTVGSLVFQLIEGYEASIDQLFNNIKRDKRHYGVICLKTEEMKGENDRLFPGWSMRQVDLNADEIKTLMHPINALLSSIADSQSILARYTQPTVKKLIESGINPLKVPVTRVERVIMFCDITSFTSFTEALFQKEDYQYLLIDMLNTFFTVCSQIIEKHHGEVTKFIGDSILAYFPGDRSKDAIACAREMFLALSEVRAKYSSASPSTSGYDTEIEAFPHQMLYATIGLSKGFVIEGNMGSKLNKQDYTVIGDAVNCSSRLQSYTKETNYALLFDDTIRLELEKDGVIDISEVEQEKQQFDLNEYVVNLGQVFLRGKNCPVPIYSLNLPYCVLNTQAHAEILEFLKRYTSSGSKS